MDPSPWLVHSAVRSIEELLRPQWRIFEYGSGGSTLFFARRCAVVISVEHDARWQSRVCAQLARSGLDTSIVRLRPPERSPLAASGRSDPDAYVSGRPGHAGLWYERYVRTIDEQPDGSLDLVLIDGRCRPACVRHAIPKIRPGGWLVLDDSQRFRYAEARRRLRSSGWSLQEHRGPRRHFPLPTRTDLWRRPEL